MLIFKLHSISCAITNSSTELYIIDNDIDYVREIIDAVINIYESVTKRDENDYRLYKETGKVIKEKYDWFFHNKPYYADRFKDDEEYLIFTEPYQNLNWEMTGFIGDMFEAVNISLG